MAFAVVVSIDDNTSFLCKYCEYSEIEDEFHIVCVCSKYADLRKDYLPWMNTVTIDRHLMYNMLSSSNIHTVKSVAMFFKHVFNLRSRDYICLSDSDSLFKYCGQMA